MHKILMTAIMILSDFSECYKFNTMFLDFIMPSMASRVDACGARRVCFETSAAVEKVALRCSPPKRAPSSGEDQSSPVDDSRSSCHAMRREVQALVAAARSELPSTAPSFAGEEAHIHRPAPTAASSAKNPLTSSSNARLICAAVVVLK